MFVCNFKINKKMFMKIFNTSILILAILILVISIISIFKNSDNGNSISENQQNQLIKIESSNYTNFLKDCHENMSKYLGSNVNITGYVYRLPDFKDNQFVLARTMLINSNSQAVVVGILSESDCAKKFNDYCWVEVSGQIEKGNYFGELPILKITDIKETKTPEDEFVYEPTD